MKFNSGIDFAFHLNLLRDFMFFSRFENAPPVELPFGQVTLMFNLK